MQITTNNKIVDKCPQVSTVMEKHGKYYCQWKSMENNLVMENRQKNKVMEIENILKKVMELLYCLSLITHEKFR